MRSPLRFDPMVARLSGRTFRCVDIRRAHLLNAPSAWFSMLRHETHFISVHLARSILSGCDALDATGCNSSFYGDGAIQAEGPTKPLFGSLDGSSLHRRICDLSFPLQVPARRRVGCSEQPCSVRPRRFRLLTLHRPAQTQLNQCRRSEAKSPPHRPPITLPRSLSSVRVLPPHRRRRRHGSPLPRARPAGLSPSEPQRRRRD